jgi:uncharacterized damage-inducible protein DinB
MTPFSKDGPRSPEIEHLAEEHRRALRGEAWHGPSVLEVLEDVGVDVAARRPVSGAHTIWEIVRHIETWDRVVLRRIQGDPFQPSDEENWPPVGDLDEASWKRDVAAMIATHEDLNRAILSLTPEALEAPTAPGRPGLFHMVYGAIQHEIYHAGQIAILRKD